MSSNHEKGELNKKQVQGSIHNNHNRKKSSETNSHRKRSRSHENRDHNIDKKYTKKTDYRKIEGNSKNRSEITKEYI